MGETRVDLPHLLEDAHAAYRRALASRSEGYHIPPDERRFVNAFLTRWGEALEARAGKRRATRS